MRKILLLTLILLATLSSFAQGFTNYKAMITDDSGNVLSEQSVTVRFTVFDNDPSTTGVQVFQETQDTTTDTNGIIILNIGEENPLDWFGIDWSIPRQYLQVEYDTGSGFVNMGTQVLNSVPYSEYAFKAQNSIYAEQASEVDFSNITNVPAGLSDGDDNTQLTETEVDSYVSNNGYLTTEVDGDTTNELQTISKTGSTVTLSDGGGSFTDDNTQLTETQVDDYVANNGYLTTEVDGDATNELQTISKTGSTVTLSDGGGSFTDDNTQLTETQVDDYVSNNGYATELNDLSDAKTGGFSTFIGLGAGANDDGTDHGNTATGYNALYSNDIGSSNTAIGFHALYSNTEGELNTATAYLALYSNTTGRANTASGSTALYMNTEGDNNTANGFGALYTTTTGSNNTAIGFQAGTYNQTGSGNVFLGFNAGYNETGSDKLYIENSSSATPLIGGNFATDEVTINGTLQITGGTPGLGKVFTSDANGKGSWETPELNDLRDAKTDGYSVFIGEGAGQNDDGTDNHNTAVGSYAGWTNQTGTGNIFIGYKAGYNETGSNKLYITNTITSIPLIGGDFATNEVTVNGNSLTIDNVGSGAQLFIKSSGSNRPSTQYFLDDIYKTSTGYNIDQDAFFIYHAYHNVFIKDGNILPDAHKTRDLGADGTAWDDVYADNFVNQGAAAFTDRSVTNEIITHPPIAKKDGDFDAKTKDGLYELNPDALPQALRTKNGIKIDEIATYNYKANYEQQVIINKQQNQINRQQNQINTLSILVNKQQALLEQLTKEIQTLKQK